MLHETRSTLFVSTYQAMNAFLVKIVYQIVCGDGLHTPQFDEQLRYLTAQSEAEAIEKATAIGAQEEDVFYNQQQQLVQWKFIAVSELYSLQQLADGAEVFSQIKETEDAVSYCRFVQHKAGRLSQSQSSFTLQPH